MRALSLAVVMVFALTTGAAADDAVDWSEYVDDSPAPAAAPAAPTATAKPAKAKRAKRVARAKRAAKVTKMKARKKVRRR